MRKNRFLAIQKMAEQKKRTKPFMQAMRTSMMPQIWTLVLAFRNKQCMTLAATAKGEAEKTPSPSTITLTQLDSFPDDLMKKHLPRPLHHVPQPRKWCLLFQL